MKKILAVLILAIGFYGFAQESALLRLNYNEGDIYEIEVIQEQSTGVMGTTDMTFMMEMEVTGVKEELIDTKSKITSIAMDMNQAGISMSYSTDMEDDELDATGLMLKNQLSPMLESVIFSTMDPYGNVVDNTVEPPMPGMEQITTGQTAVNYPKEEVRVGSSWTTDNEQQGMKVNTTYTVANIENGMAYIDIKGDVTGIGTGSMSGNSIIDLKTGATTLSDTEIKVTTQGVEVSVVSKVTMTKK